MSPSLKKSQIVLYFESSVYKLPRICYEWDMLYAMIYSPGPAHDPDATAADPGPLADHVALMHRITDSGRMVMGGPFTDGPGGMSVVDVASRAEAEAIAREDPAVRCGFFEVEIRAWDTSDRREPSR